MVSSRRSQKGAVAVIVAIALLALLAMVGLALDTGHLVLNKSRLQSTVDAAALAAAKVLDATGSQPLATATAQGVFNLNAASQPELASVLSGSNLVITYSNTLSPFVAGSAPAYYVRVLASGFRMSSGFANVVGIASMTTQASAVAGPSAPIGPGQACNIAPMLVCGNVAAGAANNWGYSSSNVTLLKLASGTGSTVGPGNFQLIQVGGPGADVVRNTAAGADFGCLDASGSVTTKPGNNVGPVAQGLNTRFDQYSGGGMNAATYPPDVIYAPPRTANLTTDGTNVFNSGSLVTSISSSGIYSWSQYQTDVKNANYDIAPPTGVPERRVLAVPIADCSTMVSGQGTLPVLGFGCFFMLQPAVQQGTTNYVYAQFIGSCDAGGTPGPSSGPVGGPGIYKIVLHKDVSSADS